MAIKGGDAIFVGNDTVVLDRLQSAGPGQLNIPTEKIYELGNYKSVAVIRDTPDLTFSMDSYDVSCEVEEWLIGGDTRSLTDGVSAGTTAFTSATAAFVAGDVGKLLTVTSGTDAGFRTTIASITSATAVVLTKAMPTTETALHFTVETNLYDLSIAKAVDIVSQFKPGKNKTSPFNIVGSVGVPFLTLESVSYRFGLRDNARQSYGLRGDSIFYNRGAGYIDKLAGASATFADGVTNATTAFTSATAAFTAAQVGDRIVIVGAGVAGANLDTTIAAYVSPTAVTLAVAATSSGTGVSFTVYKRSFSTTHPAYAYTDGSGTRRVLAVIVDGVRQTYGADYTCTEGAVTAFAAIETVHFTKEPAALAEIRLMYSSPDVRVYDQTVHATAAVKPAAIRGRDIDVYINGYNADDLTSVAANKWTSVQSVQMDWRVTLDKDEEFGNYYYVAQDFDVPAVTGTITLKPRDPDELYSKIRQITSTTDYESIGPNVAVPLSVDIILKDGANQGKTLKRLHSGDARFSVPGFSLQVQQKSTIAMAFESDSGELLVYKY